MVGSREKLKIISLHSQKRSTEKTHRCHVLVDWIIHLVRLNIGLDSISPISLGSLFVLFFEGFGITQFISRVFDTGEITCLGLVLSCTVVDLVWIWEGQYLCFTRLMDFCNLSVAWIGDISYSCWIGMDSRRPISLGFTRLMNLRIFDSLNVSPGSYSMVFARVRDGEATRVQYGSCSRWGLRPLEPSME